MQPSMENTEKLEYVPGPVINVMSFHRMSQITNWSKFTICSGKIISVINVQIRSTSILNSGAYFLSCHDGFEQVALTDFITN
jgi:hypothetical protein